MPTFSSVVTDVESLTVDVTITGLTVGERYDVYRLAQSWNEDDDVYDRIIPDRRSYWSIVAHRRSWEATGTTRSFRDYEAPMKPIKYFIVRTDQTAPFEYDWTGGDYPLSRGDLSTQVVHLQREQEALFAIDDAPIEGNLVLRSTSDLGLWADACLYDMDVVRYTARGTEFPVIGRQFPIYVADSREARRGTMTLMTKDMVEYDEIREIVYPQTGRISPIWVHAANDKVAILDDMVIVPLDIDVEVAGVADPNRRFITIDFVEIDPSMGLPQRTGDNDDLVTPPKANFAATDYTPNRKQKVTLTDASTGQFDNWKWTISRKIKGKDRVKDGGYRYGEGPHQVSWGASAKHYVTLRVWGPYGASTRKKYFKVGK